MSICAELNKSGSLIKKKYALIYRAILRWTQRGCVEAIVSRTEEQLATTNCCLLFCVNSADVLIPQITRGLAEQQLFLFNVNIQFKHIPVLLSF